MIISNHLEQFFLWHKKLTSKSISFKRSILSCMSFFFTSSIGSFGDNWNPVRHEDGNYSQQQQQQRQHQRRQQWWQWRQSTRQWFGEKDWWSFPANFSTKQWSFINPSLVWKKWMDPNPFCSFEKYFQLKILIALAGWLSWRRRWTRSVSFKEPCPGVK